MAGSTAPRVDSKTALTLEKLIFGRRLVIVVLFSMLTLLLAVVAARGLRIDASFNKQLPLKHEYMQTFVKHQGEFGGANRVLIALVATLYPALIAARMKPVDGLRYDQG